MQPTEAFENELATVKDHGIADGQAALQVWVLFSMDNLQGDNGEELTIKAYMSLSDNALPYSLQKLAAIGWHGQNIEELDKANRADAVDLTGRKALITTEIENYNGKDRVKVKFINDPDKPFTKAADPAKVTATAAKLKGKIAAFRAKNPPPVNA